LNHRLLLDLDRGRLGTVVALNFIEHESAFIKEDGVAEENAAAKETAPAAPVESKGKSPILLYALAIVNMAVVLGVGFMLYKGKQKEAAEPKIEQVIKGEHDAQAKAAEEEKAFVGKVVPLETFIVNLSGSKGRRIAKVNMELELKGDQVAVEIEKRKAQIRDIIIIILSSKTYDEVSTRDGKDGLKNEIKDTLNAFLTKGKIVNVYFTEFIYN
jgi:flagellar FliL protein